MIIDAGKKASEHSVMFLLEKEHQIRRALEQKGMVFYEPADGERIWKEQVMKSVWPKFYSSIGGREQVDKALQVLGR